MAKSSGRVRRLLPFLVVLALLSPTFVQLSAPGRTRGPVARRSRGGETDGKLEVGDAVSALCPDDDQWYPGAIDSVNEDGTFSVKWEDPEGGPETHILAADAVKKIVIFKDYKGGEAIEAVFPDDGYWYPAKVLKANEDGTFAVKWEDPDGGPEQSDVQPKDMKYPPIPWEKLEVGQKYSGTIRSVLDFGAFVDIGAEADGLLHISRIMRGRVDDIYDVLSEGQIVDVWISGKKDDGKFGLTMVEGVKDGENARPVQADISPFADISPDQWLPGVVARIAPFGAFVTVNLEDGTSAEGLLHLSKIKEGFVENVEDELHEGQEVKVRIESVDLHAKRMALSMVEAAGGGYRKPQDFSAFEGIDPESWVDGAVASLAPFGAFVTLTKDGNSADGLLHIRDIRDGFVESIEDELSVGQEVKVRVESVDAAAGRMSLSMKPPM